MGHEVIYDWLGLPPGDWPPDHYRLLGLQPGEGDASLIEQRVHQRLDTVRCYQMLHPEQATEAMNRLAQAFVCLTEPAAKKLYDMGLFGDAPTAVGVIDVAELETVIETRDSETWQHKPVLPPPLPVFLPPPLPSASEPALPEGAATAVLPPPLPEPSAPPGPIDSVIEAAQLSPAARRGLGTKRALYHRIARTRKLLRVWEQIGRHLATPRDRPLRRAEVLDVLEHISEFQVLLRGFPALLGEAGQPGYLVLALDLIEPALIQKFTTGQREQLSNDWKAGQKLLTAHRDFLRHETRSLRKRNWKHRLGRSLRAYVTDQPAVVLVLLGLLALNIAIWRTQFR